MDLSELLDVTEPVTVRFMDHDVTGHVFTSGSVRLTREEREILTEMNENRGIETGDDAKGKNRQSYNAAVDTVRATLPIILRGVDLDDGPLIYKGKGFPENVPSFPDQLLFDLGNAALDKWNAANPTRGEESPIGSQPNSNQSPPAQSQELSTTA